MSSLWGYLPFYDSVPSSWYGDDVYPDHVDVGVSSLLHYLLFDG